MLWWNIPWLAQLRFFLPVGEITLCFQGALEEGAFRCHLHWAVGSSTLSHPSCHGEVRPLGWALTCSFVDQPTRNWFSAGLRVAGEKGQPVGELVAALSLQRAGVGGCFGAGLLSALSPGFLLRKGAGGFAVSLGQLAEDSQSWQRKQWAIPQHSRRPHSLGMSSEVG